MGIFNEDKKHDLKIGMRQQLLSAILKETKETDDTDGAQKMGDDEGGYTRADDQKVSNKFSLNSLAASLKEAQKEKNDAFTL